MKKWINGIWNYMNLASPIQPIRSISHHQTSSHCMFDINRGRGQGKFPKVPFATRNSKAGREPLTPCAPKEESQGLRPPSPTHHFTKENWPPQKEEEKHWTNVARQSALIGVCGKFYESFCGEQRLSKQTRARHRLLLPGVVGIPGSSLCSSCSSAACVSPSHSCQARLRLPAA